MVRLRPHPLYPGAALVFAFVTFLERPIAARRPTPPELTTGSDIWVTNEKDSGLGSLRWAIFEAAKAQGRVGIRIASGRIELETPLPPLLNPAGVVLEAPHGVEIDGLKVPAGALLDIDSPGSVVSGLRLRGAAGQGILVRSQGVTLRGLTFTDCEEGVHVLSGAEAVTVEGSTFDQNGKGVVVDPDVPGVAIHRKNRFRKHDRAAIWAVSPSPSARSSGPILVQDNDFEDDRMSLVLIHVPARVEGNRFLRPGEAAVYVTGAPVVNRNRVDGGAAVGIYADAVEGGLLEENEVSHCLAVGILLRQSRNLEVRGNRLFGNGYGIAVVLDRSGGPSVITDNLLLSQQVDGLFMVGASPVVQDNRILGSRYAGLRILDYVPVRGARRAALPVLRGNVLEDNRWRELRGVYPEPPEARQRQ